MTNLAKLEQHVESLNANFHEALDLISEADDSALSRRVEAACCELNSILASLKDHPHNEPLAEDGECVYPIPNKDMRDWVTSDGRMASTLLEGDVNVVASSNDAPLYPFGAVLPRVMTKHAYRKLVSSVLL